MRRFVIAAVLLLTCTVVAQLILQNVGRGCTTIWYIDEDCDTYGVAVRSSAAYGTPGLGDKPDADDTDKNVNTPATLVATYDVDKNSTLEAAELKAFLVAKKGLTTAGDIFYIAPNGNNDTAQPNDPTKPFAGYHVPPLGQNAYGVWRLLKPGDVVVWRGGTYLNPDIGAPQMKNGTPSAPIVLMTMPGEAVKFSAGNIALDVSGSSDVIVDGFQVDNTTGSGLGYGMSANITSRVTLRNIEIQRFSHISIMQGMQDLKLDRLVIHHQGEHGLYFGTRELPATNVTVSNSLIYKNGIEMQYGGIQFNGRVTNLRIVDNIIHSNGQWGISFKQGVSNSFVQNNLIFNNQVHGIILDVYPGDGLTILPYSQTGNLFENNTIWIGALDLINGLPALAAMHLPSAVMFARNIGTDNDGKYDQGNNTFRNNIFNNHQGPLIKFTSNDPWVSTTRFEGNVVYQTAPTDQTKFAWLGNGSTRLTFAEFQSAARPLVTGNTFVDPKFVAADSTFWNAPQNFNLRLQDVSAAKGKGYSFGGSSDVPPPPPPVINCVIDVWVCGGWTTTSPTQETRVCTTTVLTQPSNGGLACPALTRTESRNVTVSPCISDPLRITAIKWPTSPVGGTRSGAWNPNGKTLVHIQFLWNPQRLVATDTRGCSITVPR